MNAARLEAMLSDLPLGGVRFYKQVGSTNLEAARWADDGAPDLALVIADEQTAGRGRGGRSWSTPPGAALAFSMVLREPAAGSLEIQDRLARLTALGALAVCQALEAQYGLAAQIKWPNDVLLGRRKVCGILCEAHWQGDWPAAVILGIGVNVAPASAPADEQVIYPATSVAGVLGRPVDRVALLHAALAALIAWRLRTETADFLHAWDERLAFKGETVRIFSGTGADAPPDEEGRLLGLDEHGCLRLSLDGEERRICNGEMRLRPAV